MYRKCLNVWPQTSQQFLIQADLVLPPASDTAFLYTVKVWVSSPWRKSTGTVSSCLCVTRRSLSPHLFALIWNLTQFLVHGALILSSEGPVENSALKSWLDTYRCEFLGYKRGVHEMETDKQYKKFRQLGDSSYYFSRDKLPAESKLKACFSQYFKASHDDHICYVELWWVTFDVTTAKRLWLSCRVKSEREKEMSFSNTHVKRRETVGFPLLSRVRLFATPRTAAVQAPSVRDPTDCSRPGSPGLRDSPGKNTGVGCHSLLQGEKWYTCSYLQNRNRHADIEEKHMDTKVRRDELTDCDWYTCTIDTMYKIDN